MKDGVKPIGDVLLLPFNVKKNNIILKKRKTEIKIHFLLSCT